MITIYLKHYENCPLNQKHKTEHELGLSLLSQGLSELHQLNITPDELPSHIGFSGNQKPYLSTHPKIHFNISHCDGLVACAFSDSPVGVDIEKIGRFNDHILRKLLTDEEKIFLESLKNNKEKYEEFFYRFWTLKESRIKHSGLGLAMPLTDFTFKFDLSNDEPVIVCSEKNLHFYQQILGEKYILSVCLDDPIEQVSLFY